MTNLPKRALFGAAALSALAFATAASAQNGGSTVSGVEVVSAGGGLQLATEASTGSRLGLTPFQTPAAIQVITGETARLRGDMTIVDATQRATGILTVGSPGNGGGAMAARGFGGVYSVMQLYNGLQLFVGNGTVTFPFDSWMADRIEVLSGPSSVLNGTGALGATINVVSRQPERQAHGEARITGGSYGTFRAALDYTGPINDKLSYRVDGSYNRSDGWVDRGGSKSVAASAAIRFDASPKVSFTLSNDFGLNKPMNWYGTPVIDGKPAKALREENYNVRDATMRYLDNWTQLKTDWQVADNVTFRNNAYLMVSNRHWRASEANGYTPATGLISRNSYLEILHYQLQYGDRADFTWKSGFGGMDNTFTGGFDVNRIHYHNKNNSPFPGQTTVATTNFEPGYYIRFAPTAPVLDADLTQRGFFAEDRLVVLPKLSLVGGLRNDRYDLTRFDRRSLVTARKVIDFTSWRAGVVYEAASNLSFYGQYSNASEPVNSLLSMSATQQQLKLTTGRQWEGGVKAGFLGGRGQATFALYHIVKNNLLAPDPLNPTVSQQIGRQSSRGAELSVAFNAGHGLTIEANGTVLKAKFDDFGEVVSGVRVDRAGNRPPTIPNVTANLFATWRVIPKLELLGGVRYVGERYVNNANTATMPDYAVVDAGARYLLNDKLSATLRLYNALNAYYQVSPYNGVAQRITGAPRSVELSLNTRF